MSRQDHEDLKSPPPLFPPQEKRTRVSPFVATKGEFVIGPDYRQTERNPKDQLALDRLPMGLLPAIGAVHGAQAIASGLRKGYGPYNWREKPILLSEYISAIERHIAALKDGEWFTRDDPPLTHLGCLNANTCIVLDAQQCGTLVNDMPRVKGEAGEEIERYKAEMTKRREKERE